MRDAIRRKAHMKPEVVFVIPGSGRLWGSTYLRGIQLCEAMQTRHGDRYTFRLEKLPDRRSKKITRVEQRLWASTRKRERVYFFTKQCVEFFDPVAAQILQRRSRAVLFDYVDTDMTIVSTSGADVHLCASFAQFEYLMKRQGTEFHGEIELLPHAYDARLGLTETQSGEQLRAAYVGASENTFIPEELHSKIDMIDASKPQLMDAAFSQARRYNFHYCVRPQTFTYTSVVFKPFTKGLVAAVCGANVIANRETHDVEALLGDDYPYIVDTLASDKIIEVFDRAETGFGGPEWRHARQTMSELIDKFSPESVADDLDNILRPMIF